jgi:hypothetical protein
VFAGEGITGAKMEKACDEAHITLNKNAVVGDSSAMNPGGVRIGEALHCAPHTLHDAMRLVLVATERYRSVCTEGVDHRISGAHAPGSDCLCVMSQPDLAVWLCWLQVPLP